MWKLGDVNIVVTDFGESSSQIIARLQPLASGTVLHFFGYEDPIVKLTAFVVGETDKSTLNTYKTTASLYTLTQTNGNATNIIGDFYVKSVSFKREPVIKQSIRQDLDCTSPVYSCEIEIYPTT